MKKSELISATILTAAMAGGIGLALFYFPGVAPPPDLALVSASYHVIYPDQTIAVPLVDGAVIEPLICPSDSRRVRLVLRYNRELDAETSGRMFEGSGYCGCVGIVGASEFVNVRDFVPGLFEWRSRTGERFSIFFVPGDANGDGKTNMIDASFCASRSGQNASPLNWRADVNGDGKVSVIDVGAVASRNDGQ